MKTKTYAVNYEKDQFASIDITYDDATRTVTLGKRQGKFPGMLEKRTFEIVWVDDRQGGLALKSKPQQVINYDGEEVKLKPN
jgi:alpha-D-xyloside xylohydrolase